MLRRLLVLTCAILMLPVSESFAGIYGTLTGSVKDKDGKPVIGASIRIEGTKKGSAARPPQGEFRIPNLVSQKYTVIVTAISKAEYRTEVQILPDRETRIEVVLQNEDFVGEAVVVTATRMVDADVIGTERTLTSDEMQARPVENVAAIVNQQAGTESAGSSFRIRGSRAEHTSVQVDGVDVGDDFTGSTAGSGSDLPTVSVQATETVQVVTGGQEASSGQAIGGVVNTVTRTGNTEKYEGYLRYKMDVPFLWGNAENGLQAQANNNTRYEVGLGGPMPFLNDLTFFVSYYMDYDEFRGTGLEVIDPLGNNISQLPDNQTWVQNLTAQFTYNLSDNIRLNFGGMYGATSIETASWGYLYNNDFGVIDGVENGIEERRQQQLVYNINLTQLRARVNHTLNDNSFYDLTVSWVRNSSNSAKRKSFDGPGFLGSIELWEPTDEISVITTPENDVVVVEGSNKILDNYEIVEQKFVAPGAAQEGTYTVRNPITGYIEGGTTTVSTYNPYGLSGYFTDHGNSRSLEYRSGERFQVDGDYTLFIENENVKHDIATGFEFRQHTLRRHYNSLPWNSNPFYDVYTDEWGGNLYANTEELQKFGSEPKEPMEIGVYLQDRITYKDLIITPSVRVDVLDPNSKYRVIRNDTAQFANIDQLTDPWFFEDAEMKVSVSPRLNVAYKITDNSNLSLNYSLLIQKPTFNSLFDSFNTERLRGSQIIGNPNMAPEKVKSFQIAYSSMLSENFALDVTAYYKDMFNLAGLQYVASSPTPYTVYYNSEYANAKGLELSLRKRITNHFGFNINYTLAVAKGTASNTGSNYAALISLEPGDEFSPASVLPLQEYYLSYDRRHYLKGSMDFVWGDEEGPTIGGLNVIEHTRLNLTGYFRSGLPYTRVDEAGNAKGEFLGERQPDRWQVDLRLERDIPMKDLFGESMGNTMLTLFVDVFNFVNRVEPVAVYPVTGDPDYDGTSMRLEQGDFATVTYYRDATEYFQTYAPSQFDRWGRRLYQEAADFNNDGLVTQSERYESYQNLVEDLQARKPNYQFPRRVMFGARLTF